MIGLLDRLFARRHSLFQRGITGTETAIVIAAGAAVVATMAATLYVTSIDGSDDTVFAGLQEAASGLEPRGGVVGFTGALPSGDTVVYKIGFVVAGAPDAEPVDLAGNHRIDGAGIDPDSTVGSSGVSVRYRIGDAVFENVPWTVSFLGFSDGDMILETDEKVQFSVWLLDRDNDLEIGASGAVVPRVYGTGFTAPLVAGDEFTIEVESQPENVLRISRVVPDELTPILDMR